MPELVEFIVERICCFHDFLAPGKEVTVNGTLDGAKYLSHAVNLISRLTIRVAVSLLFIFIALSETFKSKFV